MCSSKKCQPLHLGGWHRLLFDPVRGVMLYLKHAYIYLLLSVEHSACACVLVV
jgi:hypothetical protein